MKRFLFTLLLSGALWSAQAQTAYNPFLDVSYARTMNTRISGGHQATPSFVTDVISSLGQQQNAALVGFLNHFYGYPVWDRSEVFTAYGNQTALTPMVFLDGNSITGILISVNQNGVMHYGIMDLSHLFPFAADIAPGTPGMPGERDVLAQFAYFNHELFGEVDCNIIQALYALAPKDSRQQGEDLSKSCYYNIMATTTCWHMYGVMPGGEQIYLYSECSTSYNWVLTCLNPGGGFGSTGGTSGGSGGPGGGGSNTEITDLDNSPCQSMTPTCSHVSSRQLDTYCLVNTRISGCNMDAHDYFLSGLCTHPIVPGINGFNIRNHYVYSFLTSVSNISTEWDPTCSRVTYRCGSAVISFVYVYILWGTEWGTNSVTYDTNFCYFCVDC